MASMIIRPGQHVYTINGPQIIAPRGAVVPGWWEAGGASGAIAVYQPKGAASLAASYTDLSGNGNDAAPGVAPTWAGATGWIFNGTTQYLLTGVTPTSGWSMLVQFSGGTTGDRFLAGSYTTGPSDRRFYVAPTWDAAGLAHLYGHEGLLIANPRIVAGNMAIAGAEGFLNGASEGAIAAANSPNQAIFVGAVSASGVAANYFSGDMQALAIYNTTLTAPQVLAVATAMAAL